jgi:hypothetical protein
VTNKKQSSFHGVVRIHLPAVLPARELQRIAERIAGIRWAAGLLHATGDRAI